MMLYALRVSCGLLQVCCYDDGMGDALSVLLGTTAFVAGRTMWVLLPPELKSVAVHAHVMYAPHPYMWMGPMHTKSTRLDSSARGSRWSWSWARCRHGRRGSARLCRWCVILLPFLPDLHLGSR
jgi:hypothetical protein